MMSSNEIREKFLSFFESKKHKRVRSSSLVPYNDPTLLFTNAGMNQFKDVFLGAKTLPYKRATTSQKCVRAGGKHNDLESVGRTARHHTFFEMLGNFSFGDYFKKEAIEFAWEFLIDVLELPKDKLWVTVYKDDDEAFDIWKKVADIPENRIVRLGKKDNFWSMGDTGPCGPCSEIFIDRGEKYSCSSGDNCRIGKCDCDRWRELWNLVFMQYDRDEKGRLSPLPHPSIDTGMGLERIATVMQNVYSNYDTDLLRPIISFVEDMTGKTYYPDDRGFPFRVIADHARAVTFLISDGVLPGNEGRNYVLRRILRRAARYGKELDLNNAFLYKIVPKVVQLMKEPYPELEQKQSFIQKVVKAEEERFLETLSDGLKILDESIGKLKAQQKDIIPGDMAFMLYDTYGFPLDLTQDIAREQDFEVDIKTFDMLMEKQRNRAKSAQKEEYKVDKVLNLMSDISTTRFVGYEKLEEKSKMLLIISGNNIVEKHDDKNQEFMLVLDRTPFYPEGGGQVGDTGIIKNDDFIFEVKDTQKTADGKIYHIGKIKEGIIDINSNNMVYCKVDKKRRKDIARNHTATHLLHTALRQVLGEHVNQSGSLVDDQRLRFDFSHFEALTKEEIIKVENLVNEVILKNLAVTWKELSFDEAQDEGAIALFGEKYGDLVRMVSIGDFSKELCGGTHINSTGEAGLFKIISESSVGAGIRRIEAVCANNLLAYIYDILKITNGLSAKLNTRPQKLLNKIDDLLGQLKDYSQEIDRLKQHMINESADTLLAKKKTIYGVDLICSEIRAQSVDDLRNTNDILREKLESGIIVLGAQIKDRVNFVSSVSKDLTQKGYNAGKIVKQVAKITKGGGGGRSTFAQAGGKEPDKLPEALARVPQILQNIAE